MMDAGIIYVDINGKSYEYNKGITLLEISKDFSEYHTTPIVAAIINNDIKTTFKMISFRCNLIFSVIFRLQL